jgi:hypothetical protein
MINLVKSYTLLLSFLSFTGHSFSQDTIPDHKKLNADFVISLNSNGIASIPAFSLNKPDLMASVSLTKGRFSYDPTLAYSLEFKPWFIDNWVHYKIIDRPSLEFRTGMNLCVVSTDYHTIEDVIIRSVRFFAVELAGTYKFNEKSSVTLVFWDDNGIEKGTIRGHYINLSGRINEIFISRSIFLSARLQVFGISYTGKNDGFFTTPSLSASMKGYPVSVYLQATQPLQTNIVPYPGFNWNVGMSYSF